MGAGGDAGADGEGGSGVSEPNAESVDTGHTSHACDCGHHWDSHMAVVGGCSGCSCKKHPPNQPPGPPATPECPECRRTHREGHAAGCKWMLPKKSEGERSSDGLQEAKKLNTTGAERIAAERRRQEEEEGWTPEHDAEHTNAELATAGVGYAMFAVEQLVMGPDREMPGEAYSVPPSATEWPWHPDRWKPSTDPIRNLVKAGALIAAEIDRLAEEPAPHIDGSGS